MITFNNTMKRFLLSMAVFFFLSIQENISQITFLNGSFEGTPSDATTPQGWLPASDLSTPDILPGFWGVSIPPSHGNTYVGIITRENATNEQMGQALSESLKKGQCYSGTIDLAHSDRYSGYEKPIKLRIWVGNKLGHKGQVVYLSPTVDHENWKTYEFSFKANQAYKYILLEAFYQDGYYSYKGHVLLDYLTPLVKCTNA